MTKPTPCCWYGLPALPLNETTLTEDWSLGSCTLHVFGPLGVLDVSVSGDQDQDWWPREHYEVEVDLGANCELLTTKKREFVDDRIPAEVLWALESKLRAVGHCPDGPVEFAEKATTDAQRALAEQWARANMDAFDEAEDVLWVLSKEDDDEEAPAPRHWLTNMRDVDDNRPLGLKAREAI